MSRARARKAVSSTNLIQTLIITRPPLAPSEVLVDDPLPLLTGTARREAAIAFAMTSSLHCRSALL